MPTSTPFMQTIIAPDLGAEEFNDLCIFLANHSIISACHTASHLVTTRKTPEALLQACVNAIQELRTANSKLVTYHDHEKG